MYIVTFADKSTYQSSPDVSVDNWSNLPNLPISSINLIHGNYNLLFEGGDAYNYFVEKAVVGGVTQNSAIVIMKRMGKSVEVRKVDLMREKFDKGIFPYGKEYRGSSTSGWRPGTT